jgi:hypothetical protein
LGMLRLYLSDEVRLHVWNEDFKFKDASTMHTHPWNFHSFIVAGGITNTVYAPYQKGNAYNRIKIKCGEGCEILSDPEKVHLAPIPTSYGAGEMYTQQALEIHDSSPLKGTVTIVTRTFLEDRDHAFVFYPINGQWNTAEPRPATEDEIIAITSQSLERWFE